MERSADDHADGELRVGDAITRTVTASGQDTLSVLIPPLIIFRLQAMAGTGLSDASPTERYPGGREYLSTREDQTTYIVQRGGELTLPALELAWWNSQTGQLQTLTLPGQTLQVRHTPASWLAAYWHRCLE
ncbi:BatD family protein [Aeromonas veronii]|nr:BatD family protein [Aeromonas veronii]